jgi:hypothetical protein
MRDRSSRLRVAAATTLASASACTGGINAGEKGGLAFIVFTGMLLVFFAILWLVLGRED